MEVRCLLWLLVTLLTLSTPKIIDNGDNAHITKTLYLAITSAVDTSGMIPHSWSRPRYLKRFQVAYPQLQI